jgi:hypothetical protein
LLGRSSLKNGAELYEALGQVAYPKSEDFPDRIATCGALAMELKTRTVYACKGPPSEKFFNNPPVVLTV